MSGVLKSYQDFTYFLILMVGQLSLESKFHLNSKTRSKVPPVREVGSSKVLFLNPHYLRMVSMILMVTDTGSLYLMARGFKTKCGDVDSTGI